MEILNKISEYVVDGEIGEIMDAVQEALDGGVAAKDVLNEGLLVGMSKVGDLFKEGEMFVPEVLISAKTMETGMSLIKPLLVSGDIEIKGKILMATVKGDLHDIGKKLVCMMLEGAGFEIKDLGVDVSPEAICEGVKEYQPDLVGMSAMLTTTMLSMKDTVEALKANGLYNGVKVMIGGAPVNEGYGEEIGAKYSADATGAVDLAKALV